MFRGLRIGVVSLALLPFAAAAAEVCVAVRPVDDGDGWRKYEIWLERGEVADFTYAWSCEITTSNSTSEMSNSTFVLRKPDEDDKLGSCLGAIEPSASVRITVDLATAPSPISGGESRRLDTMAFAPDAVGTAKPERQCGAY
jgi:hypothetical protein